MPVKKKGAAPAAAQAHVAAAAAAPAVDRVTIAKTVSAKIDELNAQGILGQGIRKPKVAKLLCQVPVPQAISILEGVLLNEESIADPNTFVNTACQLEIDAAADQEAEAADEEVWDEGWEEEDWAEGAEEEQWAEGAEGEWAEEEEAKPAVKRRKVAAAKPASSSKVAAACEDRLSPAVAKRVRQLNVNLDEPIELKHCGESLAELSAGEALKLLDHLDACGDAVDNPTAWIIKRVSKKASGAKAAGEGESATAQAKQAQLSDLESKLERLVNKLQRDDKGAKGKGYSKGTQYKGSKGGDDFGNAPMSSADKQVLHKVTEINRNAGLDTPLRFARIKPFLDLLPNLEAKFKVLDNLAATSQQVLDPNRWMEVACAKYRASKDSKKGKGKGKGKKADPKVLNRLKWINENVELLAPLEIDVLGSALAWKISKEGAMRLLKNLVENNMAQPVRNPTAWLLGALSKIRAQEQAAGQAPPKQNDEDEEIDALLEEIEEEEALEA